MRRTSGFSFVATVLLAACSKGPSTAAGALGEVDLASRLPVGVAVPPDAEKYEATFSVCPGGKDDKPATIHVRWTSFTKDGARYVSSYAVELEQRVAGLTIALDGEPKISNASARTGGPPLAAVAITLKCTRKEGE